MHLLKNGFEYGMWGDSSPWETAIPEITKIKLCELLDGNVDIELAHRLVAINNLP